MLTSGLLKNPIVLKENIVQTFIDFFFCLSVFSGRGGLTNKREANQAIQANNEK